MSWANLCKQGVCSLAHNTACTVASADAHLGRCLHEATTLHNEGPSFVIAEYESSTAPRDAMRNPNER